MSKVVSAGLMDTLLGLLGTAGKSMMDFTKVGIELGKVSEEKNIYKVPFKLKDGTIFTIKYKYLNDEKNLCKLMVSDEENNTKTNPRAKVDISNPKIFFNEVMKLLDDGWGIKLEDLKEGDGTPEDSKGDFTDDDDYVVVDDYVDVDETSTALVPMSARKINVTLQKVCSAEESHISLVRVYGTYDEKEMASDLDTLLDSSDLLDAITEEPVSFEITDDGEEFDVNLTEMSEKDCITSSLLNILKSAFKTLHNLQAIHWNAKGDRFEEIHRGSDSFIWNVRSQIDTLAELCVELTGTVPHPALLCQSDSSLNTQSGFEGEEALCMIKQDMSDYIYCLEFYLPNFSEDVQGMMNTWIRDMKHCLDYQMSRSMNTDCAVAPKLV